MAFSAVGFTKLNNLNPLVAHAAAPGPGLWHYVTADLLATVIAADYFTSVARELPIGSRILVDNGQGLSLIKTLTQDADDGITTGLIQGAAGGGAALAVRSGQHVTVDENDTVVTGLATITAVVVSFNDPPAEGVKFVSGDLGDQAGAPAAGSFLLKTWKDTDADAAIVAATAFGVAVNWIAFGT